MKNTVAYHQWSNASSQSGGGRHSVSNYLKIHWLVQHCMTYCTYLRPRVGC